jgi:protein-disulfide isomerase-like protein with CxxC motif
VSVSPIELCGHSLSNRTKTHPRATLINKPPFRDGLVTSVDWKTARPPPCRMAAIVYEMQDQVVEFLFAAYFVQGFDLSQQSVLAETVIRAGLPRTEVEELLAGDRGAAEVCQLEQTARETGVNHRRK